MLAAQHLLQQALLRRASHRENAWPSQGSTQTLRPDSREAAAAENAAAAAENAAAGGENAAAEQDNSNFGNSGTAAANDELNNSIVFFDNDHEVDETGGDDHQDSRFLRQRRAQIWKLIGFEYTPKGGFDTVVEHHSDTTTLPFNAGRARLHRDRPRSAGPTARLKLQFDAKQPARPATAAAGIAFEAPPPLFGNDVVNSATGVG